MSFCTAVNCIDGRVQEPVSNYLRNYFKVKYVDSITEAGPNLILSNQHPKTNVEAILQKVKVSVEAHSSKGIGIAAHHDCAGNPSTKKQQLYDLNQSGLFLQSQFPKLEIVKLWIDEEFKVIKLIIEK